jgi:tetratricopeptide (TPR) repeat protein
MTKESSPNPGYLVPSGPKGLSPVAHTLVERGLFFVAEKQIDYAYTLISEGDKAGAVQQLRQALHLTPGNAGARYNLAQLLCEIGDFAAAIEEYREVVRVVPDDEIIHLYFGITLLMDTEDFSAAISEFREVIRIEPDNANAHSWLGEALMKSGDFQGAIAAYQESIRLVPWDIFSHLGLGQALHAAGERDGASIEFYQVLFLAKKKERDFTSYTQEIEIAQNALRDMGMSGEIN